MRRLYTLLLYPALPLVALVLAVRAWRERAAAAAPRGAWRERLGAGGGGASGGLWVHAVSVGEVQAAAVLIDALRGAGQAGQPGQPGQSITLSCTTPTARMRARALLPDIPVRYAPYDLPSAQRRCLMRLRPRVLVLMEGELWPNLLEQARRLRVPTVIASARLSARSARWYARLPGLLGPAMRSNVWVAAQSAADAQRFAALGVPAERLRVCGNIKFDRAVPRELIARGAALRAQYAAGRPVWAAGSVHPGELAIVLRAHRQVLAHCPQALLVLAPRHAYRFEEAATSLQQAGLPFQRRSQPLTGAPFAVLLLDTLGELMEFYAAADAAFVGGSLVNVGGHNLLEPAALGVPVVTGEQHFNSPDIARVLTEHGALQTVTDAASLAAQMQALLTDEALRAHQGERAREALQAHRGALAALLELMAPLRGPSVRGGVAADGRPQ